MSRIGDLIDWLSASYIRAFTRRRGELVGVDVDGNCYYRERHPRAGERVRRWVIYSGSVEASQVPPEWHGWLHYQLAEPIQPDSRFRQPWQKPHLPNQTGTAGAYRPPGHVLEGGRRSPVSSDYQAWTPD